MDKAEVIIPPNHPNPPELHEVEAAWILAHHLNTTVEFLIPINGYKTKTHDLVINGIIWEMKSPEGNSKTTVGNQFKNASKQRARYLIFDARRTTLKDDRVIPKIRNEIKYRKSIRRVLFIAKNGIVIEIGR
jgi:hypothetical protein